LLAGCSRLPATSPPSPSPRLTIRLATHSPLSGSLAALGDGIRLGSQLAVEQKAGAIARAGFSVEVVAFDDEATPDVGIANARRIVSDPSIVAVIGHLNSGVALPASEIYRDAGLVMISPANTNPLITDRGLPNVNRVLGRDDVQGGAAARFAKDELGVRTAYVTHHPTVYGRVTAEAFRAHAERIGVAILGFDAIASGAMGAVLARIRAAQPDAIYFGGEYHQAAPFLRLARAGGSRARFLGPDGLDSREFLSQGGSEVSGTHFTTVAGPADFYPDARAFLDDYRRKFAKAPEPFAAQAYDAASVALQAVEAVTRDRPGVVPAREAIATAARRVRHRGVTGDIEFDGKGDLVSAEYLVLRVGRSWGQTEVVHRVKLPPPARP
jgi:branched-chain amino acid transport system substrate-binding protein